MCNGRTSIALLRAFKEITQSLIGLLSVYDSDPQLAQDIARTLRNVFLAHIERNESHPESEGESALHDLLKEIETIESEIKANS